MPLPLILALAASWTSAGRVASVIRVGVSTATAPERVIATVSVVNIVHTPWGLMGLVRRPLIDHDCRYVRSRARAVTGVTETRIADGSGWRVPDRAAPRNICL